MVMRAPNYVFSLTAFAALSFATSGCTFFKELIGAGPKRPIVKVEQIEVTNATFSEIDLEVTLKVDNPNSFELRLSQLKYSIDALDLRIASGAYEEAVVVPPEGRSKVTLPVSIDSQNAVALAKAFLQSTKELSAIVRADALFDSPIGEMEVNFEEKRPLGRVGGL